MIRRHPWLAPAGVFAAVLLAYLPALRGGLVWNDADYVTAPALQSLHGLARIWWVPGATEQYYPVLHTAFWIEHRLWGGAPLGYHLANCLLHAAAACLFALALARFWRGPRGAEAAWLAALLFALHPVCVESVAWISEQKNTLSLVFYLAAGLHYLRYREKDCRLPWALGAGFFLLAILSKSVTATLPAALLVVVWWQEGTLRWRRDVRPLLPWFALGAADGLFTAWVERRYIGAEGPAFGLDLVQRCLVAGHVAWFYLGKLLWPSPLIFMYPRWRVDAASAAAWTFPIALMVALGLLAWWARGAPGEAGRGRRGPLAGALFFVGSLFPVLGFFNVYAFVFSFVADHFQYLACLGIIALAGAAWRQAAGRPAAARTGAACVLAACGVLTWRQSRQYRDVATLYRATVALNPGAWLAQYNLGVLQLEASHPADALGYFQATLRSSPDHPEAESNLGLALTQVGRPAEALPHFRRALELQPDFAGAQNSLGSALRALGRDAEAEGCFRQAVRLQPDFPEAWYNLGVAQQRANELPAAVASLERALRLRPRFPAAALALVAARNNDAIALFGAGRRGEAVDQLRQALALDPNSEVTHLNLAAALNQMGDVGGARREYDEALRLKAKGPALSP